QTLLKPPQIDRLRQLVMRVRGWPGIIDRPAAQRLALSADQIRQIEMITDHTQQEMQRIAAHARDAADRADSINRLRAEETETIQDLLTAEQRQKLAQLLGEPFDLSQVRPLMFQAPELTEV